MSTTIDQRVAELRFDNAHFEKNVATSMSTLDKLKQKLNLTGASKGLNELNAATKKVKFDELEYSATRAGFQLRDVWLKTATVFEYQIAGRIVQAASKMAKALTIDPIMTGFSEYETQINATQTILANTQSKGSTIEDVNKALEELNKYADLTIYNFTEMTRNIGTFTAAGIDLDTSVNAIQGIANLAAVSGSTSQQASTAMYQLSQALASGTVKLMDWNSVVNAGMGGQVFQDALKKTSTLLGTGAEAAIKAKGSFRESLSEGWLTAEVLTETLKRFTTSGANEYVAEYTGLSTEAVDAALKEAEAMYGEADAIKYASEALAEKSGKNKKEIQDALEFAKNATDAATKVKTFTQLWDVLKEAAQSGWSKTWKLIVGDFEQAKNLLTPLADFLTGIINKFSDWRNEILESALAKNFKKLADQIKGVLDPVAGAVDTVKGALVDYDTLVDQIIRGEWKNAPTRWQDLAAAGYDWAHAQNLVNERLGCSVRHATNYKESTEKAAKSTGKMTDEQNKLIAELVKLSDAELKAKGYSEEQIKALRELEKVANKLGLSVEELLANIDQIDGRWLLINSFKNIGQSLVIIFKAIGEAWNDAFGFTKGQAANKIFDFLAGFHRLSRQVLDGVKNNADELTRTLKGVFAIFDLLLMVIGGPIKIAFKILTKILGMFNLNILDVTAAIGDVIVKFRNWVEDNDLVTKTLYTVINVVKNLALAFWELEPVQKVFKWIKDAVQTTSKTISDGFGKWIDLINELSDGVGKGTLSLADALKKFGKEVKSSIMSIPLVKKISEWIKAFIALPEVQGYIEKFSNALGKVKAKISGFFSGFGEGFVGMKKRLSDAISIGKDLIAGLQKGLQNGTITIKDAMIKLGKYLIQSFKDVLGIHSPSTVFMAIGGFIIAGLLGGLMGSSSSITDFFTNLGENISGILSKIPWGSLFAGGVSVGMLVVLKKLADAFGTLAAPLEGLGDLMSGAGKVMEKSAVGIKRILKNTAKVVKSFSKVMNAFAFSIRAKALKDIAVALAILVGSLLLLTLVKPAKLWNAVGVVAALAGVLLILAAATKTMSKASIVIGKNGAGLAGLNTTLLGIAAALLVVAIAAKMLSGISWGDLTKLGAEMVGLIAALVLVTKIAGDKLIGDVGDTLIKMSAAMLILTIVAKQIAKMSWGDMGKAAVGILGLVGIITLLTLVTRITAGRAINDVGTILIKIAAAIAILTLVAKTIAGMSWGDMGKAAVGMLGLVGIIALLTLITKIAGDKLLGDIGDTLVKIAAAMLILTGVAKILAGMSWGDMGKAAIGLAGLAGVIYLLVMIVKSVEKDAPKIAATLLAMSLAIGILAVVAIALSLISIEGLVKGIIAVGLLSAFMIGMVKATKGATDMKGSLIAMAAAIGVLAVALIALSFIDPTKLIGPTLAMGTLMGMFALIIKAGGTVQSAMGPLIVMTAAIAVVGTILIILAHLPVEQSLGAALGLSVLLLAMAGAMVIMGTVGAMATSGLIAMGVLTLVVVALAVILYKLQDLPIESTLGTATALSMLLLSMSAALAILGVVGLMGPASFIGIAALATMIVGIGGLVVGIGALMTKFPQLEEFLNKGLPILGKIGSGIGQFFGSLISGFAAEVLTILPALGASLSAFMVNLTPFITGAKMVDASVLAGIGIIAGSVLLLTAADLIAGIGQFLSGGTSFAELGSQLSQFMMNAIPFITMANMIKPEAMTGVKSLAEAILILTGANLIEGLTKFFGGESSLGSFGSQLGQLGTDLKTFVTNLGTFSEDQVTTVKCAGQAIKALASAASEIPNEGGWAAKLLGENSLATFGSYLPQLGTDLKGFITNLGTFTEDQVTTIDCAGKAIKALASAASEIPNEGGWAAKILGDNSLATFGSKLPKLGTDLKGFITNLGTFGEDNIATVKCAGNAIKALAEAASNIPNEGGLWAKIAGDNSLATFGSKLPGLATNLKGFITNLGSFGEEKIAVVNAAVKAIKAVAKLGETDIDATSSGLGNLGKKLEGFGKKLASFVDEISEVGGENITNAVSKTKELINLAKSAASTNIESLSTFGKSLKKVASEGVKGFVKEFDGEAPKSKVTKAAKDMMNALIKGLGDKKESVEKKAKSVAEAAVKKMKSEDITSKAKSAGKALVNGFAEGISEQTFKAEAKARAMANAAEKAAKEALDINSPSKVFRAIGYSVPEGFAMGIDKLRGMVTGSVTTMADGAINGVKTTIARISDYVNTDIDTQPTIRPVLDLSDVTAGANTIGGLFNNPSLGVMANVRAISSSMNNNQNGGNDDIVSAINKLRKDLGNVGGTTNNYFDGINAGSDEEINNAIGTLVRAARMGGRA